MANVFGHDRKGRNGGLTPTTGNGHRSRMPMPDGTGKGLRVMAIKERRFNYEKDGGIGVNYNPPLTKFRVDLGKDKAGKVWMCQIKPTGMLRNLMWNVDFDNTDEWLAKGYKVDPGFDSWSIPFYRIEVIYAKDGEYSKAAEKYYNRKTVEYKDIYQTICGFVEAHGIE